MKPRRAFEAFVLCMASIILGLAYNQYSKLPPRPIAHELSPHEQPRLTIKIPDGHFITSDIKLSYGTYYFCTKDIKTPNIIYVWETYGSGYVSVIKLDNAKETK